MICGRTKAIFWAGMFILAGSATAARAVEIPIQIPDCPERDGTDLGRDPAAEDGQRSSGDERTCGGGGGGADPASAYPGVRSTGGAGGGAGGGGGSSARSATSQTNAPAVLAVQALSTGDVTSPAAGDAVTALQPAAAVAPPQVFNSTGNITYPAPPSSALGDVFDGGPGSVGHVAPLPDVGGIAAWLIALTATALFWRRRVRV